MTGKSMDHIIDLIETRLPGWRWLVRTKASHAPGSAKGSYFANVYDPDFDACPSDGESFTACHSAPALALLAAYSAAFNSRRAERDSKAEEAPACERCAARARKEARILRLHREAYHYWLW